jgi:hypothetical protein
MRVAIQNPESFSAVSLVLRNAPKPSNTLLIAWITVLLVGSCLLP